MEIVCDNSEAPPRVRFTTEMWHPNITKDGIPFIWIPSTTKDVIPPILLSLQVIALFFNIVEVVEGES